MSDASQVHGALQHHRKFVGGEAFPLFVDALWRCIVRAMCWLRVFLFPVRCSLLYLAATTVCSVNVAGLDWSVLNAACSKPQQEGLNSVGEGKLKKEKQNVCTRHNTQLVLESVQSGASSSPCSSNTWHSILRAPKTISTAATVPLSWFTLCRHPASFLREHAFMNVEPFNCVLDNICIIFSGYAVEGWISNTIPLGAAYFKQDLLSAFL